MTNALDSLIGKILGQLPQDPYTQIKFIYYLNMIIVGTLGFFTISNIWNFFNTSNWSYLFGGILTGVFMLMSLFSLKSSRDSYIMQRDMNNRIGEAVMALTPEQMETQANKDKPKDYIG